MNINAVNTVLAKMAVTCLAHSFVVNQSLVHRINICGKNRHLRKGRNITKHIKTTAMKTRKSQIAMNNLLTSGFITYLK
jgi:hypothetical protein